MFPDLLGRGVTLREWEYQVEGVSPQALTWETLLGQWDRIETDFQAFYHLDLTEYRHKSLRWFQARLVRLLGEDTSLGRFVRADGKDD